MEIAHTPHMPVWAAIFASCHTQGATQFWVYRIYDSISFLTFLFAWQPTIFDSADEGEAELMRLTCVHNDLSACVYVRVCAWPFGFQSTLEWHSNQLHISMFKWANMQQRAECRERHSFMLHLHNSNLLACTWLKFHLSHLLALLPVILWLIKAQN